MAGINRFNSVKGHTTLNESGRTQLMDKSASPTKPCVFLSHKSEDKAAVKKIAEYLSAADVDYYLDIDDPELQHAVTTRNHKAITEFIDLGINNSTHLLTVVSEKTKSSWWVPYEVGGARAKGKDLSTLQLKNVDIPSYLHITRVLKGTKSLNEFIKTVKLEHSARNINEGVIDHNRPNHPLDDYLNFQG